MPKELNTKIVEQWERLKVFIASTEDDILKNARGNANAGVRVRKGLRALRNEITDLVKLSIEADKAKKANK
jgi:hypothetical protein